MLKVRNLTESLEKKYDLEEGSATLDELPFDEIMNKESTEGNMDWYKEDHPDWKRYQSKEVDEAYDYEMEDELDYIMDDDSLSDDEKKRAISDLYSKYKLEGYNRPNSLTEAYRFKVIPEDPDRWGCSTEEEFQDILNLEDEEIVKIVKSTDGAPYYDITFDNGKQLYGVAQNCIYMSTDESLKEDWDDDYYDGDKYSLVGQDGNAFALMGYTARCMKECGLRDEISKMREEAMSSDYNNLICVCDSYVQKCNDIARDMDESYEAVPMQGALSWGAKKLWDIIL